MRFLAVTVLLLPSCGGDDAAEGAFDAPACEEGQVVVEGTLDGEPVHEERTNRTLYEFVNVGVGDPQNDGRLEIGFASGDRVHFEFSDLLPNGATVDARGSVDLASTGGPQVGNCTHDSLASRLSLDEEGGGGTFLLRRLRWYCDTDGVLNADGELAGCF